MNELATNFATGCVDHGYLKVLIVGKALSVKVFCEDAAISACARSTPLRRLSDAKSRKISDDSNTRRASCLDGGAGIYKKCPVGVIPSFSPLGTASDLPRSAFS